MLSWTTKHMILLWGLSYFIWSHHIFAWSFQKLTFLVCYFFQFIHFFTFFIASYLNSKIKVCKSCNRAAGDVLCNHTNFQLYTIRNLQKRSGRYYPTSYFKFYYLFTVFYAGLSPNKKPLGNIYMQVRRLFISLYRNRHFQAGFEIDTLSENFIHDTTVSLVRKYITQSFKNLYAIVRERVQLLMQDRVKWLSR